MALRGPVRESSVLLKIILNQVARGTQEKRWQRRDPDQQFPLNRIFNVAGSPKDKNPSPEMQNGWQPMPPAVRIQSN
jgi:hypothetical protein